MRWLRWVALALVVSGCGAFHARDTTHPGMSARSVVLATRAAERELRADVVRRAVVTSVTAQPRAGTVAQSNTGDPCTSGHLVVVRLIGVFPEITTGGTPVLPGSPVPDTTVHAVELTVDARSGVTCLLGVQTGQPARLPVTLGVELDRPRGCFPSRLKVTPTSVGAGGSVTVSSGRFACGARYRPGKLYALELAQIGRAAPVTLGVVPVHPDGSFRATVAVPSDASPGESSVHAVGSRYDEPCPANASCAGYAVALTVAAPPSR